MTSLRLDRCAVIRELMVDLVIDELAELIVEVEEQMVAPARDVEEHLAVLFVDDDDSGDDDSEGLEDDEEVWEYGHGLLVKKVITVSDAEVADSIVIGEIGPRVSTVEDQMQVMQAATQRDETIKGLSQQVQTLRATVQHRDVQIQQLQTLVAKMSSREGTLMQCILGMDRRLADLERRPSGPQHIDIPESHGKMVRRLDDEIPRNRMPTLRRDLLRVARFLRWVEAKVVSSEYEAYVSGESSSGQDNVEEPGPSTSGNQEQDDEFDFWTDSYASDDDEIPTKQVSQDIMEEISLTIDEAKLKKMAD
ncbi:hypothetical protein Tco_0298842 [Tanacetum coccineum]